MPKFDVSFDSVVMTGATPYCTGGQNNGTAYGKDASVTQQAATALGDECTASGTYSIAAGWRATASGAGSVCVGLDSASATGSTSTAIGYYARAIHNTSIALGGNSVTTQANQLVIGDSSSPITQAIFPGTGCQIKNVLDPSSNQDVATKKYVDDSVGGKLAQIVSASTAATQAITATIPVDDTIPQNTEGDAITGLSVTITPTNAASTLLIEAMINVMVSGAADLATLAIFKDSNADAIAATWCTQNNGSFTSNNKGIVYHEESAGSTTARTYTIRAGGTAAGCKINADSSNNRYYGGVAKSWLKVTEILP